MTKQTRLSRNPLIERLALWRARLSAWRSRATGFGLSVRAAIWLSGFAAILLAAPEPVRWGLGLPLAALLPLFATAKPGGFWSTATVLAALTLWTAQGAVVELPSLALALCVGAAAYVHHASAAVAALWRTDVAVDRATSRGWLRRVCLVVGVSALLAAVIAGLSGRPLPLSAGPLVLLGAIGALGIVGGTTLLLHRR
ncbi:MAG: hypothetical protein ACRDXX_18370 [Stackebrandtia sp.]